MRKYQTPELTVVRFEPIDRTNTDFGPGDGNDPGFPGSGGEDYSDPINAILQTVVW